MPADKWQQWMPFHIDRFCGSRKVQSMTPAARAGYLYLLCSQYQSVDCTIPDDNEELAHPFGAGEIDLGTRKKYVAEAISPHNARKETKRSTQDRVEYSSREVRGVSGPGAERWRGEIQEELEQISSRA